MILSVFYNFNLLTALNIFINFEINFKLLLWHEIQWIKNHRWNLYIQVIWVFLPLSAKVDEGYIFTSVWLFVCLSVSLFVCEQDISKKLWKKLWKDLDEIWWTGWVCDRTNWLDFDENPDTIIFFNSLSDSSPLRGWTKNDI